MSISLNASSFVDDKADSIGISQLFTVVADTKNPTYLVLTALDRNEYTVGASGATGSFSGNGHTAGFSSIGDDGRGAGIVFTYNASTGRYYNSIYGYFDQLTYNMSSSLGDVANLSLFGTNNLSLATAYASDAYDMVQADTAGYLGSATVVTQAHATGTVPAQATPDSIATTALSFVGNAWNMNGCWILASTIAAEAGASLPVASTASGLTGQANGEWIVAYNGPVGQSGNWQSLVKEGEIVVIGTPDGGGHITTCVSGSGATAMLVDNAEFLNGNGQISNTANDGSASDVILAAPHLASQEWADVAASSVVIYQLDTPVITDLVPTESVTEGAAQSLSPLFAAIDPANKAIMSWQIYDTAISDMFVLNGVDTVAHSAASALTTASLTAVSLLAGATQTTDTVDIRAFNGSYWGDWQSLGISVTGAANPVATPPVLALQTANQIWTSGRSVSLTLPASTFTDPRNEALAYTATLAGGQALPGWLTFNPTTQSFSGIPPTTAQTLPIIVTVKDTSGLSASETFSVKVIGAPVLALQTPNQSWTEGQMVTLTLPASTFSDPQNQALVYTATQANSQALPAWLTFNAATDTFSGTAPSTAQSLGIKVTATDSSGLTASETFSAGIAAPVAAVQPAITVTEATQHQIWTAGQTVDLMLPSSTFTDALGLKMKFAAYEVSGPNVTSWLRFAPATETFFGIMPAGQQGTITLSVQATDADHVVATDMFGVTLASASRNTTHAVQLTSSGLAGQYVNTTPVVLLAAHG